MGIYCISLGAADTSKGFTSFSEMASLSNLETLDAMDAGSPNLFLNELFVIVLPSTNLTQACV